jgi:uncharacterized delta-60 repeat protein
MNRQLLSKILLLLLVVGGQLGYGQALDPQFAPTTIYRGSTPTQAAVTTSNQLVLTGSFSRVNGQPLTGVVRLNNARQPDAAYTTTVAASGVSRLYTLPNNRVLALATNATPLTAGGRTAQLVVLNSDGTADPTFNIGTGIRTNNIIDDAAVQPDGKIILVGRFTSFNGTTVPGVVRLNTDGSIDQGFQANLPRFPFANHFTARVALQSDGSILLLGPFGTRSSMLQLLRLTATGQADATFSSSIEVSTTSNHSYQLAVYPDNRILVVAETIDDTSTTALIVRLLANGTTDTSFDASGLSRQGFLYNSRSVGSRCLLGLANGQVLLELYDSAAAVNKLVRLLTNGTADAAFIPSTGSVSALLRQPDQAIVAVGRFGDNTLQLLTATGDPAPTTPVVKLQEVGRITNVAAVAGNKVLIAGDFNEIEGRVTSNIARLLPTGAVDATFQAPALTNSVEEMMVQPDGKVLITGFSTGFRVVSQPAYASIIRLQTDGTLDNTFLFQPSQYNLNGEYQVYALALQADGKVLLAGNGRLLSGEKASQLLRLTATGSRDGSFGEVSAASIDDGLLFEVEVQTDGKIVIGVEGAMDADFNFFGYAARLNANGTADNGFQRVQADGRFWDLALQADGKVLVAGEFASYGTSGAGPLVRLTTTGALDPTFARPTGAAEDRGYMLQVLPDQRILLGGTFTQLNNTPVQRLVRILPGGGLDNTFTAPGITGPVYAVATDSQDGIIVGGIFGQAGATVRTSVLRLGTSYVLRAGVAVGTDYATQVWPVPAHASLSVAVDFLARPRSISLQDAVGRTVWTQAVRQQQTLLLLQGLPAGVYLLRVDYADGPVTRRVVLE